MKLTKKQREEIRDSIFQNTICAVIQSGKKVWDCNGFETKASRAQGLYGELLRCNEDFIVSEILKIIAE